MGEKTVLAGFVADLTRLEWLFHKAKASGNDDLAKAYRKASLQRGRDLQPLPPWMEEIAAHVGQIRGTKEPDSH